MSKITEDKVIQKMYAFLRKIGIPVKEKVLLETTFLPGLKIENSTLFVDREKLKYKGDIIHEAGHIALEKPAVRKKINGNISDTIDTSEGTEIAIHLWSFLVCKELDIPLDIVFHSDGYKNASDWIISNFENQIYVGRPLLAWMGIVSYEDPIKVIKWVRT